MTAHPEPTLPAEEPTDRIELTMAMRLAGWTRLGNTLIAPPPTIPRRDPNPFLNADGTINREEYDRWIGPINDYLRRKAAEKDTP